MSIQAMNTTINNNRKLMPKRDKFKRFLGGYNRNKENKIEYNLPKASSKQLRDIRKRLQSEYKIRMIKVVILTVILFIGLLVFVFSNFENASYYISY